MKKKILLLPLTCLLLTGCGKEELKALDPGVPSGGKLVDITDENKKSEVVDKISRNVETTYTSMKNGFDLSGDVKLNAFNFEADGYAVKTENLGFNYSFKTRDLDKKISEWKVASEIFNFTGSITIEVGETGKKTIQASSISAGMYLDGGNLYINLSNPEIYRVATSVIDFVAPAGEAALIKQFATLVCKKIKVNNVLDSIGIEDVSLLPVIDQETNSEIRSDVEDLLSNEIEGILLNAYSYKESEIALSFEGSNIETSNDVIGEATVSSTVNSETKGNVVFDKSGNLAKTYVNEKANIVSKIEEEVIATGSIDVEIGTLINYEVEPLDFTDLALYEDFPINLILSMLR